MTEAPSAMKNVPRDLHTQHKKKGALPSLQKCRKFDFSGVITCTASSLLVYELKFFLLLLPPSTPAYRAEHFRAFPITSHFKKQRDYLMRNVSLEQVILQGPEQLLAPDLQQAEPPLL